MTTTALISGIDKLVTNDTSLDGGDHAEGLWLLRDVDLVCGQMVGACRPYARWIDVFGEPNSAHAFTGEDARLILSATRDADLGPDNVDHGHAPVTLVRLTTAGRARR